MFLLGALVLSGVAWRGRQMTLLRRIARICRRLGGFCVALRAKRGQANNPPNDQDNEANNQENNPQDEEEVCLGLIIYKMLNFSSRNY